VYEVTEQIGEGGMGQVYRATDTTLGRQVAIKMLPAAFAADVERVARFEREAKTLASLNHPHIAAIYGFEKTPSGHALVMELVEGEDLAHRLNSGAIPPAEAVAIAKQVADAIADAHERGIVHRDLKPANIKVTQDGVVKVLDFGLAKAMDQGSGTRDQGSGPSGLETLANSPTITTPAMTQAGMILGTAAYMSPEQAKGRPADKRSDIWSFGCVLFEMLAGQKAFAGEDVSETLAAILRAEPDVTKLPPNVSQQLRRIIDGCLKRDRKQRFADIAVVQHLLSEPQHTAPASAPAASSLWKVAAAIFAVTTIAALGVPLMLRRPPAPPEVVRFQITPPEKSAFVTGGRTGTTPAISPDGSRIAYTLRDETGAIRIWIRPIAALAAQPLAGTENAEFPFWSPDSQSLGFFASGKVMRIDVDGGAPQTVCAAAGGARGGAWGPHGEIVFGGGVSSGPGNGLNRVPAAGGNPTAVTLPATGDHRFPSFLPDGRHVFFYWQAPGASEAGLYVVNLESAQPVRLADAETSAVYSEPGVILFGRQNSLFAQPFDLATLQLSGNPTAVATTLESGVFAGVLAFSVSRGGTLAYGIGTGRVPEVLLTWFDREGKQLGSVGDPENYLGVELSPDGKQLAVHRHQNGVGGDLWTVDLQRGAASRVTFDAAQDNSSPVWSPDSRRIAYTSLRNQAFAIFERSANGTGEERAVGDASRASPRSWSKDGRWMTYTVGDPASTADVWLTTLDGSLKPSPLLATPFLETHPAISPDGKWLAYASTETGRPEVYVRPFPQGDGKWQISTQGGTEPRWRGDSKELFFLDRSQLGFMMSVELMPAGTALTPTAPRQLFATTMLMYTHPGPMGWWRYAVSSDGQRFIMPVNPRSTSFNASSSSPMVVVSNWAETVKK
jgi:serine/threonine protein kinase